MKWSVLQAHPLLNYIVTPLPPLLLRTDSVLTFDNLRMNRPYQVDQYFKYYPQRKEILKL